MVMSCKHQGYTFFLAYLHKSGDNLAQPVAGVKMKACMQKRPAVRRSALTTVKFYSRPLMVSTFFISMLLRLS